MHTTTSVLSPPSRLPLVVEPRGDAPRSTDALLEWIGRHHEWIEDRLAHHGGILLRGFDLRSAADFERVARAVSPRLGDYVGGTSPRRRVGSAIYTSTEAPRFLPIPLHCEMSYTTSPPARVLFFCEVAPRAGGATPVADMRRVWERIDPDVRSRFERKGIRIVRNIRRRGLRALGMKGWQDLYGTRDVAEVERRCRAQGLTPGWRSGGRLQLTTSLPASVVHPRSGERVWFNSAHSFHDSWSSELRRAGCPGLALTLRAAEAWRRRFGAPDDRVRHCTFDDGTEIPLEDIEHVRDVLWAEAIPIAWRRGDVLILDNVLAAHGRMPYRGRRRILVALVPSDPAEGPVPETAEEKGGTAGGLPFEPSARTRRSSALGRR